MQVFAARQAVFDRGNSVVGYELFFRDGDRNAFPDIDPDAATARLFMGTRLAAGFSAISGGKWVLRNFPEKSLLNGTAKLLPTKGVIIEILEDVEPSEEVLQYALQTAISYERGQWRMTQRNCAKLRLDENLLPRMFEVRLPLLMSLIRKVLLIVRWNRLLN